MRDYEVVYIFRPSLESEDVDGKLEGYHDRLDGEVTAVEHWGQRQLAYEIQDERSGYYVVVQFRADPASLSSFEQALRHDEELIRYLLVLSEGELPTPPSKRREEEEKKEKEEAPEDEGEDEEGDEDEDEADEDDEEEEEEDEDDEEEDEDDEEEDDEGDEDEDADEDDEDDEDADQDEASDEEEK